MLKFNNCRVYTLNVGSILCFYVFVGVLKSLDEDHSFEIHPLQSKKKIAIDTIPVCQEKP